MELGKLIDELSLRMRLLRAGQENDAMTGDLSDRQMLILELLNERGRMTISEISAAYPKVGDSTISTNITKLWRTKKLVSKTINPDNQRVTFVELTPKGKELVTTVKKMRAERLATMFRAMEISPEEKAVMERVFGRAVKFFDDFFGFENKQQELVTSKMRVDG